MLPLNPGRWCVLDKAKFIELNEKAISVVNDMLESTDWTDLLKHGFIKPEKLSMDNGIVFSNFQAKMVISQKFKTELIFGKLAQELSRKGNGEYGPDKN